MRSFNTEGPVRLDDHYAIPPLERVDLEELLGLIRAKRYFVLHAPRQTGKTSALLALRDLLNEAGGSPVRLRKLRGRASDARELGAGDARNAGRIGVPGACVRRRLS